MEMYQAVLSIPYACLARLQMPEQLQLRSGLSLVQAGIPAASVTEPEGQSGS